MSRDRFQHLEEIFHRARGLAGSEREHYLDEACAGDPGLRAEAESLLSHAGHATAEIRPGPAPEGPGARIGRYKLLQKLGEGGFGTVYMAEQEEPMRRKVALKVLKPGMDTRRVVARFEAERQALAMMDHPSIARVLDGGETERGRPYFVMELVKGVSITEYCDTNNLNTAERLDLFVEVCAAVQHAHQKGIIHRDLKPSNVMVTLHDGRAVPKVIDFGIAKAVQQRLTEKTLFTEFRQFLGTPEYMSPEQAEMSGIDIDTRTDVYSLGVLLYELLTGTTPFDPKVLRTAAYDELLRTIRDVEPPRPSTRVTTLGDSLSGVARHRSADPAALSRLLRGDLDWIVMMALEKDRTRRYESASALAADVRRHLGDEPVQAGPPTASYRLRKFLRRNHVAVTVGLSVAAALLLGIAHSTVAFVNAGRDRLRAVEAQVQAEAEAARARAVVGFLQKMLESVDPYAAPGSEITVRSMLDEASRKVSAGDLSSQPESEAAVRTTLGNTYLHLDQFEAAEMHLRQALEIQRRIHGGDHEEVATSLKNLAVLFDRRGDCEGAEALYRESLAMARGLGRSGRACLFCNLSALALFLLDHRDHEHARAEAEPLLREVVSMAQETYGKEGPVVAGSLKDLAKALRDTGERAEAETLLQEALSLFRAAHGEDHPGVASCLFELGVLAEEGGNEEAAERFYSASLAMRRKVPGVQQDVAVSMNRLASLLRKMGAYDEAESLYREALAANRKWLGDLHHATAESLVNVARVLVEKGNDAEAETLLLEALSIQRRLLGEEHSDTLRTKGDLAILYLKLGRYADAEPIWLSLHAWLVEHPEIGRRYLRQSVESVVALYEGWGKLDRAAEWRAKLEALPESERK